MSKNAGLFMMETPKTEQTVRTFFEAFNKLSGEEKIYFLVAIDKALDNKPEEEKKLYLSLIKSAREGKTCTETLTELKKV
jgi:hypothetical protein